MTTLAEALEKARKFRDDQKDIKDKMNNAEPLDLNDSKVQEIKEFFDLLKNSANNNIQFLMDKVSELGQNTGDLTAGFIDLSQGMEYFSHNYAALAEDRKFIALIRFVIQNKDTLFAMFKSNTTDTGYSSITNQQITSVRKTNAEDKTFQDDEVCVLFTMNADHQTVIEKYTNGFTFFDKGGSAYGALIGDINNDCKGVVECTGEDGYTEKLSLGLINNLCIASQYSQASLPGGSSVISDSNE